MPNVIVTEGAVTGDISSCKVEVAVIKGTSRPNPFVIESTGYATNNCTSQTDVYQALEPTFISYLLLICLIVAGFRFFSCLLNRY